MTEYVRLCPRCDTERSLDEDICAHVIDGKACRFPLLDIYPRASSTTPDLNAPQDGMHEEIPADAAEAANEEAKAGGARCANGHTVEAGDVICLECGSSVGETPSPAGESWRICGWQILAPLPAPTPETELYLARRPDGEDIRLLRFFQAGFEPDPRIYEVLQTLARADVASLVEQGRSEGRAFEIWEHVEGQTLGEFRHELAAGDPRIEEIAKSLIATLAAFERHGLRHGNLQPSVVRLRSANPLALCVTDFASARVAEFDVEAVRLRPTTRYVAPEAAAQASTVASDWWSLGIILLELLTQGKCFEGVHERAFLLHLVARGITLPDNLTPRWRNLLEGLLTRNHESRWLAEQALRWADGDNSIPTQPDKPREAASGPVIMFAGQQVRSPAELAFLAAEEANWSDARGLLESGRMASWLHQFDPAPPALDIIRRIAADQRLRETDDDLPLALSLAALNLDLPLCVKGEIVTPAALLANPARGTGFVSREAMAHIRRLQRPSDHWLVLLADRAARVKSRAKEARVSLDEKEFAILQLVTSAAALELRWSRKRQLFPESDHPLLASLTDRRTLTDEDLLLLTTAASAQFKPAEEIMREAETLAAKAGLHDFDREQAVAQLARPRRVLSDELAARIPGFERCGRPEIDGWLDVHRSSNRRLPLARLLVVLTVPREDWSEPPHQDYIRNVISFLERRVLSGIQRGALVQMRATASVIDLTALGEAEAQRLLKAIVSRSERAATFQRETLPPVVADRLGALEAKARTFHRDTGLDALYLAFPLITLKVKNEEGEKTRIAPVFLWPVTVHVQRGATGPVTIGSDASRDVQLNPALETILGAEALGRWQDWADDNLPGGFDSASSLLRALDEISKSPSDPKLAPLPQAKSLKVANTIAVHASAAVFLAEFASQANARDLRQLQQLPLDGTALEVLLRLAKPAPAAADGRNSHLDRYTTLEADPSQEAAVHRSRHAPGIVVQGPPGTGKSQTIVNVITDCLGRGESVLVVCEKKAALDVVQKRLAAEKLDHRLIRVENTQTDRSTVLHQLRDQVPQVLESRDTGGGALARRREVADQLDALERELDRYHEALHTRHDRLGLSYREVLARCAREAAGAGDASVAGLRPILGKLSPGELERAVNECAGLLDVWRTGGAFGAPLAIFKPFATDASLAAKISEDITRLRECDQTRLAAIANRAQDNGEFGDIVCKDEAALSPWLAQHADALRRTPPAVWRRTSVWHSFFSGDGLHSDAGQAARAALRSLIEGLERLSMPGPAALVHPAAGQWSAEELAVLSKAVPALRPPSGFLSALNLPAALQRRKATRIVSARGARSERMTVLAYAEAARYELALRTYARELEAISAGLGEAIRAAIDRLDLLAAAKDLSRDIAVFQEMAQRIAEAPVAGLWPHLESISREASGGGTSLGVDRLLQALEAERDVARANALAITAARRLEPYLTGEAELNIGRAIASRKHLPLLWQTILEALPVLAAYQTYRLRHAQLSSASRAVFAELPPFARRLADTEAEPARHFMAALMRHEAARAWKDEIESALPVLQQIEAELQRQVRELDGLDGQMREHNRHHLGHVDRRNVRPVQEWSRTWALTGVNAQRLRQFFERARPLGLLKLRPVWLVNPDVACRMLPLERGLFDVVIFDEASQMRVASALPALYRGKRAVISGDEKQLPPTSFFGPRFHGNDDDPEDENAVAWDDDSTDEDDGDAEVITARDLKASERHIKDCEDLLTLADGVLPSASLDIHYRSEFRELIAFSNAAYYRGKLNVPVRRPLSEVMRDKPIEVRRIDGAYRNQTNAAEAAAIIDILSKLWEENASPPTVGVVTFNMKQAELIEAQLRQRADEERKFGRLLDRERGRTVEGEDVGFFVKNLENVQGDERDWIVFSTTFGRDENDVFKRVFGALNQQGGERRLNVAVTRAKRKVMLVTSMPTAEISSFVNQQRPPALARDYLQAYVRYAELVDEGDFEAADVLLGAFRSGSAGGPRPAAPDPDDLVLRAQETLRSAGFDASLMPLEDAFSLDMAVAHPPSGRYVLGVEFDSPRHHLLRSARAREVWRPKLLARSGMRVHRIISSGWVQNERLEQNRLIEAARQAVAEAGAG